jgi:hypothetical protein
VDGNSVGRLNPNDLILLAGDREGAIPRKFSAIEDLASHESTFFLTTRGYTVFVSITIVPRTSLVKGRFL